MKFLGLPTAVIQQWHSPKLPSSELRCGRPEVVAEQYIPTVSPYSFPTSPFILREQYYVQEEPIP